MIRIVSIKVAVGEPAVCKACTFFEKNPRAETCNFCFARNVYEMYCPNCGKVTKIPQSFNPLSTGTVTCVCSFVFPRNLQRFISDNVSDERENWHTKKDEERKLII